MILLIIGIPYATVCFEDLLFPFGRPVLNILHWTISAVFKDRFPCQELKNLLHMNTAFNIQTGRPIIDNQKKNMGDFQHSSE